MRQNVSPAANASVNAHSRSFIFMSVPITLWFAVLTDRMAKTPDRSVLSAALAAVSARRPAQLVLSR